MKRDIIFLSMGSDYRISREFPTRKEYLRALKELHDLWGKTLVYDWGIMSIYWWTLDRITSGAGNEELHNRASYPVLHWTERSG